MEENIERARFIKSQMVLKGITFDDLAKEIGVTRYWVSSVVNNRAKSSRIKKRIAQILNFPYEQIWGEKEDA
jgi:transcriptional regulator with XRE-family HTH domain